MRGARKILYRPRRRDLAGSQTKKAWEGFVVEEVTREKIGCATGSEFSLGLELQEPFYSLLGHD